MKNVMGLPFEYKKEPEWFDVLNSAETVGVDNKVIEDLLKKSRSETVLDFACGTGFQSFYLAKRGYQVTASDFSPILLKKARERAQAENLDIRFLDGDMRRSRLGCFDAVITTSNAVGHLTGMAFRKTLRNIHKNLKPGGIYIFDVLNLEALTDEKISSLAWSMHEKAADAQLLFSQCSTLCRKSGLLTSYETYLIQKNVSKPACFKNKFCLQLYTESRLRALLLRNGFKTYTLYGGDGSKFSEHKTERILVLAQTAPLELDS